MGPTKIRTVTRRIPRQRSTTRTQVWLALRQTPFPTRATKNLQKPHRAKEHPQAIQKYINKEIEKDAVIGPFQQIPFKDRIGISPISSRAKKNSTDRRIIIDLSFPLGNSVNEGMIKGNYLGFTAELRFPRTDDLALRIFQLGTNAGMFKIDLSRYFRQLPLEPGDYSLIGYIIDGNLYFDKVLPMGMRTTPYIAQRVTNAIRYIHEQMGYFLLNYVDDFLGAETKQYIHQAFNHLKNLLELIQGYHFFPLSKFPDFSSICYIFP